VNANSVKNAIVHFLKIFIMKINHQDRFLEVLFISRSLDNAGDLEKIFPEDEVWKAITDLGNEKAAG